METNTHLGDIDSGIDPVPLFLTGQQRNEHLAIIGSTGVGKSTLLRCIAAQDIARGDGILYVDPHGDDAEALLDCIPAWRHNHVCYLSLADLDWPIAFNVLEDTHPDDRARTADALVSALRDIWFESWGHRMENVLRQSALALLDIPNASIALIPRLLTDDAFRLAVVRRVSNPIARSFFENRFEAWRDAFRSEAIEPVMTRLDAVLSFPAILNTVGQHRSTLHLEHAMRHSRIIIVNLCKGIVGDTAANLTGALLIARARTAGMARARLKPEERHPFHVVVDEVQTVATNSLPSALAELRKFAVSVSFATQMLSGLSDRTRAALLGTVGTTVAFRLGPEDAEVIAPKFNSLHRTFNVSALNDLGRGETFVKIGADDVRHVLCPAPPVGIGSAEIVRRQSRRHYGRQRAKVHKYIEKVLDGDRRDRPRGR